MAALFLATILALVADLAISRKDVRGFRGQAGDESHVPVEA